METKKKQSSISDRILPAILMGAALSVGGILYVPYTFYVPFQTVFGLTNTQIGTLTAAYASLAVPGYLVGGVLGDKFNAKILTVIAVISTSLLSLWMATIPGYKTLLLIYFIMSFTLGLLLWTSQTKCVRLLGSNEEQGRLNGIAGMTDSILSVVVFTGFATFLGDRLATKMGMRALLIFFGLLFLAVGIAIIFFYDFKKYEKLYGTETDDKVDFKMVVKVIKMPAVWIMASMSFGAYVASTALKYINPFLSEYFLMPVAMVSIFGAVVQYAIPIVATPIGGFLRDKQGASTPVIIKTMIPSIALIAVFMFIPKGPQYLIPATIVALVLFAIYRTANNFYYTTLTEMDIPLNYVGTLIGVAFMLGYSSDLFLPAFLGHLLDKYGLYGYYATFGIAILGIVMYIIAALVLNSQAKKLRARKAAEAAK